MVNAPQFSEMSEEERAIATEASDLRIKNLRIAGALEQLGADVETGSARLEHLLLSLVELGVITPLQMWNINLDWEKNLNQQLRESHTRVVQQRQAEARAAGQKKLAIPGRDF